jgi:hypothetical protein
MWGRIFLRDEKKFAMRRLAAVRYPTLALAMLNDFQSTWARKKTSPIKRGLLS